MFDRISIIGNTVGTSILKVVFFENCNGFALFLFDLIIALYIKKYLRGRTWLMSNREATAVHAPPLVFLLS